MNYFRSTKKPLLYCPFNFILPCLAELWLLRCGSDCLFSLVFVSICSSIDQWPQASKSPRSMLIAEVKIASLIANSLFLHFLHRFFNKFLFRLSRLRHGCIRPFYFGNFCVQSWNSYEDVMPSLILVCVFLY